MFNGFIPPVKGNAHEKTMLIAFAAISLISGAAIADKVHDWHDLDKVHKHVLEAINEMNRARAANHYDKDGHGAKAEELLHQAEHELHDAVESAKRAK